MASSSEMSLKDWLKTLGRDSQLVGRKSDMEYILEGASKCDLCGKMYSSRGSLQNHKSMKHRDAIQRKRPARSILEVPTTPRQGHQALCGLCGAGLLSQPDLCRHLSLAPVEGGHGLSIAVQWLQFPHRQNFDQWKDAIEQDGNFNFVNRRGKNWRVDGSYTELFCCHRSGCYRSVAAKRAPRKKGSKKAGFHCSAFAFIVAEPSEKVTVTYCLEHYGHGNEEELCRISESVKCRVRQLIQEQGLPTKSLIQVLESENPGKSLTASNVGNIARAAGLGGYLAENDGRKKINKGGRRRIDTVELVRKRLAEELRELAEGLGEVEDLELLEDMRLKTAELKRIRLTAASLVNVQD